MDLDTMTTTATTSTKESTAGIVPETAAPALQGAGKASKNGSPADSTDRLTKEKDSDLPAKGSDAAALVKKPPENSATQPSAAAPASSAQPTKQDQQKSPAKESASESADQETTKPAPAAAAGSAGSAQQPQDDDMENDELSKKLEAMEKGEDPVLEKTDQTIEKAAGNHQNGLNEREAVKPATAKETDAKLIESVTSATTAATAEAKSANTMLIDDNGSNTATDAVTSNAKRKLLSDALGGTNEPETKKVHIADVTDSSENSVATNKTTETPQPLPIEKMQSKDLAAAVSAVPAQAEKPSSVEEMEVDGSPEPETSSSNNVETLPDTEPNTEPESEDKGEEISSSVADQPMKQEEDESTNSNVSSSDDKREGGREGKPKLAESEVSASALAGPSEDEAMDVDEDEGDMAAESSTSAGTTVKPVPVMEPPCIKKSAYLCYDKDEQQQQQQTVSEKAAEVKSETASPTSASLPGEGSSAAGTSGGTLVASTSQKSEETMEVDSASKAASSVNTERVGSAKDEADSSLADDSKKHPTAPEVLNAAKMADEGIVESSQPSSSSDTKKQSSDSKRADDQLRAAVHRSALLAKASSTPNSGTASAPTSSNPSTPNPPVVASAVSSSNVFSSTPIHANFECKPVTSGNVSKITNPPSSVETSRIEPDDSTELLHSSIAVAVGKAEEKETSKSNTSLAASTTSTGKASDTTPTKTESASSTAATASTSTSPSVRQTPPKKDPALKQEPQSPAGSSRSSSKTIDSSEVDSCTVVSAMNTTEEINLYKNNAKKFNGISSTSSDVSDLDMPKPTILITSIEKSSHVSVTPTTSKQLNLSEAIEVTTSSEQQYEVSVWYEGQDLQFLSIEKLHGMIKGHAPALDGSTSAPTGSAGKPHDDVSCTDSSAAKQSSTATTSTSNGSVTSLGPFPLPDSKLQASNASSDSSSTSLVTLNSQHGSSAKLSQSSLPKVKQTVTGSIELCDLIINEFRKLKRKLQPEHTENEDCSRMDDSAQQQLSKTPKTPATGRGQSRKETSVAKKSAPRGQKRSKLMQDSEEEDEHEYGDDGVDARTPKAGTSLSASKQAAKRTKQAIESPSGASATTAKAAVKSVKTPEPKQFDICCLARWTDRKYYAGRVTNQRGDKFVVIFEDGCSKTLSRDIIVFGEDGVLPILNHSIHALTGGDTYEPAIVEEIKRNETSNDVVYCVRTASSTLEIAATDIYLTDEQAKWIHNACKDKPDPIKKLLSGMSAVAEGGESSAGSTAIGGGAVHITKTDAAALTASIDAENAVADGEKGSRSTRSKRTTNDKPMTPGTPEAGYSGGVGKKGRRGRRLS
ncbi:serine-rich adhesin for platelets-like isoform X2 [Anopheles albimanus]|uniref:BRCT domain-containing protein n=1 Tax=Anopheles albimanus TaxID=7167 RepID=A0A1Y9G7A9_ANOAL|nr:serine-rich adhesin for platelets-like isoform X2 [Anopheles albimanus]